MTLLPGTNDTRLVPGYTVPELLAEAYRLAHNNDATGCNYTAAVIWRLIGVVK